jgi:hypothetical protein
VYRQGLQSRARTVIDISEVSNVSPTISCNGGIGRVFVNSSASVRHVMNSSSRTENMNAANTIVKHVKPIKREDLSANATIEEGVAIKRQSIVCIPRF